MYGLLHAPGFLELRKPKKALALFSSLVLIKNYLKLHKVAGRL
jgi:hypothetical protein